MANYAINIGAFLDVTDERFEDVFKFSAEMSTAILKANFVPRIVLHEGKKYFVIVCVNSEGIFSLNKFDVAKLIRSGEILQSLADKMCWKNEVFLGSAISEEDTRGSLLIYGIPK